MYGGARGGKGRKEESSFSEEKEAKRLLSFWSVGGATAVPRG
jgi:hypothetical protein